LTLLALLALAAPALAGEQVLTYDLVLAGQTVGTRTLTIKHLPEEPGVSGASRLLESWTELEATVAGKSVKFTGRASMRATETRMSYTSTFDQDGTRVQVQGRQDSDGSWQLTRREKGTAQEISYRRSEVDLSTFDLLDPSLRKRAVESASTDVLIAETGVVVNGPARDLGEDTVRLGGLEVPVNRWAWDPTAGAMEVAWTQDGLPVQYSLQFLGQKLTATARELPPSDWGSVQVKTFQTTSGGSVLEEEL
jgi:hypothetical protein